MLSVIATDNKAVVFEKGGQFQYRIIFNREKFEDVKEINSIWER